MIRGGIAFLSGIFVARGLSPSGYGDLTFMLGSFVAVRSLLDMGTSSAFYTFLSKRPRSYKFYLFYFFWLLFQFVATLSLVGFIIPDEMFEEIWVGHHRKTIALAFVASFVQQQLWQMVGQIGESSRKTIQVQLLNIGVSAAYFGVVSWLYVFGFITVERVLIVTVFIYGTAVILSYRFLVSNALYAVHESLTFKEFLAEFWSYCKPMMGLSIAGFLYAFIDKWVLQKFGGSTQQGYFQIASQFAAISLLATISVLNIFWKEIAEATENKDFKRIKNLYLKINRGLVILSSVVAGLLMPWSKYITVFLLGQNYSEAWVVMTIMFLYPIHQSMGQIGGAMFMAGGHTRAYMVLSICIMVFTLPLSYLSVAPTQGVLIPGLGLGALGMASYMVCSSIISVNIQAWVLAKHYEWKFDWLYQVIGIPVMLLLGYVAQIIVKFVWNKDMLGINDLIVPILCSSIFYVVTVLIVLWFFPWFIGMNKEELKVILKKLKMGRRRNEIY